MAVSIEPHIWANDLARSIKWYEELGFEPSQWFPSEQAPTWCQLAYGDASLMIAVVPVVAALAENQQYLAEVARRAGSGGPLSLYLHVEDADAVFRRVISAGQVPIEDLWDPWWGGRQFTVADPDGTWWTIFQSATNG